MFVEEEFSVGTKYSEFVCLRKSLGLRLLEAEGMFSGSIVCVCPVHLHLHQGWGDLGHACGNALVVDLQLQTADSKQGWDTSGNDSTVAPWYWWLVTAPTGGNRWSYCARSWGYNCRVVWLHLYDQQRMGDHSEGGDAQSASFFWSVLITHFLIWAFQPTYLSFPETWSFE